nr:MAG TPA: hypothetical protein [Caudoviricetes sp.]
MFETTAFLTLSQKSAFCDSSMLSYMETST